MPRRYIFADESGDFAFRRGRNASRYFIVCTVWLGTCNIGHALMNLRRELAWQKTTLGEFFHATTDKQRVRDAVFDLIQQYDFTIQATIMEKSKAQPQVRVTDARFYQYGWYYHFSHSVPAPIQPDWELLITAASIARRKQQRAFTSAVNDVVQQTIGRNQWVTAFWPAATDPCLQVADYCTWAIQRKWELNDTRSYDLIRERITYEYDLWARGRQHYY